MKRLALRTILGVFLLTVLAVCQIPSSGIMTPACRRVAGRLACLCGCKQTVAECQMLQCGYSSPVRSRIMSMQVEGKDDDSIVNAIVTDRGKEALAAPPTEGFSLLAWWMPFVAVFFGLGAVWLAVKKLMVPVAAPTTPAADAKLLERYKDQIEDDLDKLD